MMLLAFTLIMTIISYGQLFSNEVEMHFYNHISAFEVYNKVLHEDFCRQVKE